jgi:alkylhydroperoxidase family enzyme
MAAELGISDAVMHSIAQEDSSDWEPRLETFIRAADELVAQRTLSDDTWAALRGELSEDQAVEFCMLVGHYVMVAGLINTLGIRIEPGYLKDIG